MVSKHEFQQIVFNREIIFSNAAFCPLLDKTNLPFSYIFRIPLKYNLNFHRLLTTVDARCEYNFLVAVSSFQFFHNCKADIRHLKMTFSIGMTFTSVRYRILSAYAFRTGPINQAAIIALSCY